MGDFSAVLPDRTHCSPSRSTQGHEYYKRPVPRKKYYGGPVAEDSSAGLQRRVSVDPGVSVKPSSTARSLCSRAYSPSTWSMVSAVSGGSIREDSAHSLASTRGPQSPTLPQTAVASTFTQTQHVVSTLHSPRREVRHPPPLAQSLSPPGRQTLQVGVPLVGKPLRPQAEVMGETRRSCDSSCHDDGSSSVLMQTLESFTQSGVSGASEHRAENTHHTPQSSPSSLSCHTSAAATSTTHSSLAYECAESTPAELLLRTMGTVSLDDSSTSTGRLQTSSRQTSVETPSEPPVEASVGLHSVVSAAEEECAPIVEKTVLCLCREPHCCCADVDNGLGRSVSSFSSSSEDAVGSCLIAVSPPCEDLVLAWTDCREEDGEDTPRQGELLPIGSATSQDYSMLPPSASGAHLDLLGDELSADHLSRTATSEATSASCETYQPALNRVISVETAVVMNRRRSSTVTPEASEAPASPDVFSDDTQHAKTVPACGDMYRTESSSSADTAGPSELTKVSSSATPFSPPAPPPSEYNSRGPELTPTASFEFAGDHLEHTDPTDDELRGTGSESVTPFFATEQDRAVSPFYGPTSHTKSSSGISDGSHRGNWGPPFSPETQPSGYETSGNMELLSPLTAVPMPRPRCIDVSKVAVAASVALAVASGVEEAVRECAVSQRRERALMCSSVLTEVDNLINDHSSDGSDVPPESSSPPQISTNSEVPSGVTRDLFTATLLEVDSDLAVSNTVISPHDSTTADVCSALSSPERRDTLGDSGVMATLSPDSTTQHTVSLTAGCITPPTPLDLQGGTTLSVVLPPAARRIPRVDVNEESGNVSPNSCVSPRQLSSSGWLTEPEVSPRETQQMQQKQYPRDVVCLNITQGTTGSSSSSSGVVAPSAVLSAEGGLQGHSTGLQVLSDVATDGSDAVTPDGAALAPPERDPYPCSIEEERRGEADLESRSAVPIEVLLALAQSGSGFAEREAPAVLPEREGSSFGAPAVPSEAVSRMARKGSEHTTIDTASSDAGDGITLHQCNSAITSVRAALEGAGVTNAARMGSYYGSVGTDLDQIDTIKTDGVLFATCLDHTATTANSNTSPATPASPARIASQSSVGSSPLPPAVAACGVTVAYTGEADSSVASSEGLNMRRARDPDASYERSTTEAQSAPPRRPEVPLLPALSTMSSPLVDEWINLNITPASPRPDELDIDDTREDNRKSRSPTSSVCTPKADLHLRQSLSILSSGSSRLAFTMQAARDAVISGNRKETHEALDQIGEQVRQSRFHDPLAYRLLDEVKVHIDDDSDACSSQCLSPPPGKAVALTMLEERLRQLDSLECEESDEDEFDDDAQPDYDEDLLIPETLYFKGHDIGGKATKTAEEYDGFIPKAKECFALRMPYKVNPTQLQDMARLSSDGVLIEENHEGGLEVTIKDAQMTPESLKRALSSVVGVSLDLEELDAPEEGCAELVDNLLTWYAEKQGDVISELAANLRFPTHIRTRNQKRRALARIARSLEEKSRQVGINPVEAMVLRQYTQKPMDVDRDLGWGNVPMPPSSEDDLAARLAVDDYVRRYSDWDWSLMLTDDTKRNGSLFSPVCSALRDQGPNGSMSAWSEAVLRKWIKWLFTVAAVTHRETQVKEGAVLYRGLGAGGLPESTVLSHRCMPKGCCLTWPALSSLSFDCNQSQAYMYGRAANSNNRPNAERPGTILFRIEGIESGMCLNTLSQYPEENEVLVGPLMTFEVQCVSEDRENPFDCGLNITMKCVGLLGDAMEEMRGDLHGFLEDVRADASAAYQSLIPSLSPSPQSHPFALSPGCSPCVSPKARRQEDPPLSMNGVRRVSEVEGLLYRGISSLSLSPSCAPASPKPGRKGWVKHRVNHLDKTIEL